MKFWEYNPDIQTLTHDSHNALMLVGYYAKEIEYWFKANADVLKQAGISTAKPIDLANKIVIQKIESVQSIDYFYSKEKAKYEQKVKDGTINTK